MKGGLSGTSVVRLYFKHQVTPKDKSYLVGPKLWDDVSSKAMTLSASTCTIAPAIFWWNNFDRFVDASSGENSIHSTPGVAFQQRTENTALGLIL